MKLKKMLYSILCIAMVLGAMSISVFADEKVVAKIGNVEYATLAEALTVAQDGDTVTLIWSEGDEPIAMNGAVYGKSVTITGTAAVDWNKGYLFVGRGGAGNGTVIFDNANLTSASDSASYGIHVSGREKDTDNKYDGTLIIKDSTIELDYLINRGTIDVKGSTFTVKNGFGIAGRPASETESGEAATAAINITNNSYVKVLNHNGMGIGVASSVSEGYGVLNLTDSTFECESFNVDAKLGDFNVFGTSTLKIDALAGREIDLHHNAIIKDSIVGGEVMLYGKVTFSGDNTFGMLYDYGNAYSTDYAEWIVEKGASVTLTDKARYGLGYGDKVTIYGSLENALAARENLTEDDISFFTHGLVGMSSWNVANSLTVKDAYVVIGNNNSFGNTAKSGSDSGTYDIDFDNAVLDASRITFYEANSKTDFSFVNSDVKVGTFMTRDADSVFTLTNTKLLSTATTNGTDEGNYHAGTLTLISSDLTYSAPLVMENGTLTLGAGSSLTAPEISGIGKLVIDANGMAAGTVAAISADASGFTGTIEVINGGNLVAEINENGNIVLVSCVAKIGETYYASLQEALNAAAAGTGNITVEILDNIDLTNVDWTPVSVSAPGYPMVTVNGNQKTITGLNDMLFSGTWAGNSGLIINDLTIKDSSIANDVDDTLGTVGVGAFIGYPQASETITLNNCHLVNSTVSGGHWTGGLIGMAGGYNGNDGPVFMNLTIKDCSVKDSKITGKGSAGGVIGHAACSAWTKVVIENTAITGNTITSTGSSTNKAGIVMGTIGAAGTAQTTNGTTLTGGVNVAVTESGNVAKSNGIDITTVYGRQGSNTGVLTITGGTYDNNPIEENVSYATPAEGYEIVKNEDNTYGVVLAEPEILENSLHVTYTELGTFDFVDDNIDGEVASIRLSLFAGVDTLNYSEAGFDVTVNGTTETFPVKVVYGSVKTMMNGTEETIPASKFGKGVNYIFGQTINFPATDAFANTVVKWTPYAIRNKEKITGNTFTLSDIFPGTLEVAE